jgi:hypothetical protein
MPFLPFSLFSAPVIALPPILYKSIEMYGSQMYMLSERMCIPNPYRGRVTRRLEDQSCIELVREEERGNRPHHHHRCRDAGS